MQLSSISLAISRLGGGAFGAGAALALDFLNGNNTLDPRVTFSRTSNATLTNSAGVLTYAPHNLLTFSEQFDNSAWTKSAATVSANALAAPNGTTTADVIRADATSAEHFCDQAFTTIAGNTYTVSVSVKANGLTDVGLRLTVGSLWTGSVSPQVRFNLLDGTTTTIVGTPSASSITALGDGWYRVSMSAVCISGGSPSARIHLMSGNNNVFTGNGTNGISAWGAQLNVGALQPYYPTTVKNLLGYTQEFDNAAWTKSNSFVQTNLLTFSQEFDNAAWGKLTSTVSVNQAVAPDGTTTADKFVANNGTSGYIEQSAAYVAGNTYVWSFYAKAAERDTVSFLVYGTNFGGTNLGRTYTLTGAGSVGALSGTSAPPGSSIVSVGDGWYRCTFTAVCATSHTAASFQIRDGVNGTGSAGRFIWGAQLVQGSTAGDYQVTYGTARAVMYAAPDGSVTADKLVENTANSEHYARQTATVAAGTRVTFSYYVKTAERSSIRLRVLDAAAPTNGFFGSVDASTGATAFGTSGTGTVTAPIAQNLGGGWYRLALTGVASSTAATLICDVFVLVGNQLSAAGYTGDGTSGIYIWGAQISDSASLDPYVYNPVAAPASTAYYGPRFDYDPVTLAPKGLLIEEQRTNLITNSQNITLATWGSSGNVTTTASSGISPDKTQNATAVMETTVNGSHTIGQTFTVAANTNYAASIYLKANGRDQAVVYYGMSGAPFTRIGIRVDLSTGLFVNSDVGTPSSVAVRSLTPVGDGWYRIVLAGIAETTFTTGLLEVRFYNGTTSSYAGDPTKGMFVWGGQLEAGSFSTSYIPTTTAAATRAADVATMIGANFSNWYNQSEGTLFAEYMYLTTGISNMCAYSLDNGTGNETVVNASAAPNIDRVLSSAGGASQANFGGVNYSAGQVVKRAVAVKLNDAATSANGSTVATDNTYVMPTPTQLVIGGAGYFSGSRINGYLSRIAFYPRRLANSELQSITA